MSGRFAGRRAVVTGGAAGIGLAVAQRIVAEGGTVAIWDRDAERAVAEAATLGGIAVSLDIADWPSVERAAAETVEKLGGIDILVASAGITGPNATLEDYPPDAWKQVFDVNVHGLFHCDKAVVPFMRAGGYGRIVNIASVAGKEGNPNASAYSASKAAVIGLTKSLGKELATTGITVNCVTPAAVKTAIFDQMSEAHIAFMLSKIPIGRFGTVDEVASLVCWLASEECSFTTSAVFDVSGGRATY
ncbi:SDR family NAD(P)-dependent oxidoreductase [Aureimonas glaciei]|uniref:3-oxoacyl-ACP reductase n=1 Tax=Aureimonas glaciei TaxID=1776957 RepID=A0A916Y6L8_9HYPH|nr:SDR family NAD(P)-dependent oxidoreductase [Aureimonas glaciei]GGD33184.1 3-oxoacyl-ACP reductase [Aureimonas glaciei]